MDSAKNADIVLVGAGIMSATAGMMLKELMPDATMEIFERLDGTANESSDAWNNAGTGHSALCELNYTPEKADGSIDVTKAMSIMEQFEVSKQFWAYLVKQNFISSPSDFVVSVPHMSFVWSDENLRFLKKRYEKLQQYPLFQAMQYSDDAETLKQWIPLIMQNRDGTQPLAATKTDFGTDVDFGALTRLIFKNLESRAGVHLHTLHEVRDLKKQQDGSWNLKIRDLANNATIQVSAKFVFIGAGGGSLKLLEKSQIPEGRGFAGFPVSGQWLRCVNPDIIKQHSAKVYGRPALGAPPMSDPHLDTRIIKGERALLFGPFAGFSTKFLKQGSYGDLFASITGANIAPMLSVGLNSSPLIKYLIQQVLLSHSDRVKALRKFIVDAKNEDWELEIAGQRVQVIKKDKDKGGVLQFGTELVTSADGSIAALLGASPGASTAVAIVLQTLERCFKSQFILPEWQQKIKEIIPTFGQSAAKDPDAYLSARAYSTDLLKLHH